MASFPDVLAMLPPIVRSPANASTVRLPLFEIPPRTIEFASLIATLAPDTTETAPTKLLAALVRVMSFVPAVILVVPATDKAAFGVRVPLVRVRVRLPVSVAAPTGD